MSFQDNWIACSELLSQEIGAKIEKEKFFDFIKVKIPISYPQISKPNEYTFVKILQRRNKSLFSK